MGKLKSTKEISLLYGFFIVLGIVFCLGMLYSLATNAHAQGLLRDFIKGVVELFED